MSGECLTRILLGSCPERALRLSAEARADEMSKKYTIEVCIVDQQRRCIGKLRDTISDSNSEELSAPKHAHYITKT